MSLHDLQRALDYQRAALHALRLGGASSSAERPLLEAMRRTADDMAKYGRSYSRECPNPACRDHMAPVAGSCPVCGA